MKMAIIAASIACGILIASTGCGIWVAGVFILAAILMRIGMAVAVDRDISIFSIVGRLHFVWIPILFVGLGLLSAIFRRPDPFIIDSDTGVFTARVESRTTTNKGECYWVKLLESDRLKKGIRNADAILYADAFSVFKSGDIVRFRGNLRPVGGDSAVGKEGVRLYTAFVDKDERPQVIGSRRDIFSFAASVREKIKIKLENSGLNDNTASLCKALIIAERGGLDNTDRAMFRDAGLSHMLAVSGMHVGILASILLTISMPLTLLEGGMRSRGGGSTGKRRIIMFNWRNARYLIALAGVWIFAILSGLSYSTLRASMMFTLAIIAWMMERSREGFSSVCAAAVFILIISPESLGDIGFQLSFVCVASLCLLVEKLNPMDHRSHPRWHGVCSAILTTLVATGTTWVICAYYFSTIPLNFLTANLIVLPLLPIFMLLAIINTILLMAGLNFKLLIIILNFTTDTLYGFLHNFYESSIEISVGQPTVALWLAAVALLAISLNIRQPAINSGAVISYGSTLISYPWLIASSLFFIAAIISVFF